MSEPTITRTDRGFIQLNWGDAGPSTLVARDVLEAVVERHNIAVCMRHSLADIVEYVERDHRITMPAHDHDCYELWTIEREYAQRLIAEWDGAVQ